MANGMSHFFSDLQNWATRSYTSECADFCLFLSHLSPTLLWLVSAFFPLPVCHVWHVFGERSRGTRNRGCPHSHILQTHCGAPGRSLIMKRGRRYWLGVSWLRWRGQKRGSSGPCQWTFNIFPLLSPNLQAWVISSELFCARGSKGFRSIGWLEGYISATEQLCDLRWGS